MSNETYIPPGASLNPVALVDRIETAVEALAHARAELLVTVNRVEACKTILTRAEQALIRNGVTGKNAEERAAALAYATEAEADDLRNQQADEREARMALDMALDEFAVCRMLVALASKDGDK